MGEMRVGRRLRSNFKKKGKNMNDVVRRISLDLSRKNNVNIPFSSQYDAKARVFIISVLDNGVPYKVEKACKAIINILRSDGKNAAYYTEIMDDGLVRYRMNAWALAVAGVTKFSLSICDGSGKKITTAPFTVDISPGLYYGEDINGNVDNQSTFDNMMTELARLNEYELSRAEAEKQREANEQNRRQSEEERDSQEILRIQNEETRISNESARLQVTNQLLSSVDNLLAIQEIYMNMGEINEQQ